MLGKNTKKAFLIGLGVLTAYKFSNGDGIFNKPRFFFQHKALKKYLSSTHPYAAVGEIIKTSGGWSCIINENNVSYLISLTYSSDKTYIFHESKL